MQLLKRALKDSQMLEIITRVALQHWQWQLGTGNNPFHSKYRYPHDESKWLKELRKFTGQYQIEINIGGNEYPLQRENDEYIMDITKDVGLGSFELRFLNHREC
jgi:hypothetical protein